MTAENRNRQYFICISKLADSLAALGRHKDSELELANATRLMDGIMSPADPVGLQLWEQYADVLRKRNRKEEAKQAQTKARKLRAAGATAGYGQTVDGLDYGRSHKLCEGQSSNCPDR